MTQLQLILLGLGVLQDVHPSLPTYRIKPTLQTCPHHQTSARLCQPSRLGARRDKAQTQFSSLGAVALGLGVLNCTRMRFSAAGCVREVLVCGEPSVMLSYAYSGTRGCVTALVACRAGCQVACNAPVSDQYKQLQALHQSPFSRNPGEGWVPCHHKLLVSPCVNSAATCIMMRTEQWSVYWQAHFSSCYSVCRGERL